MSTTYEQLDAWVDAHFDVSGKPVWIAVPNLAWVEMKQRTGKVITDYLAAQLAGLYLKQAIESDSILWAEHDGYWLVQRLRAAALGLPFLPVPDADGTALASRAGPCPRKTLM